MSRQRFIKFLNFKASREMSEEITVRGKKKDAACVLWSEEETLKKVSWEIPFAESVIRGKCLCHKRNSH